MTEIFAPAKINLALHVIGRRNDGYHLLDTLVTFAPVGDRLTIKPSPDLSLKVTGPEADGLPTDLSNLALRAASLMADGQGAEIVLEKSLPTASGIGGGSADAAAALRGMLALAGENPATIADTLLREHGATVLSLGADVPMCVPSRPLRARGIGERLVPASLPQVQAVLVNPRLQVSTPDVYRAMERRDNAPLPARLPMLTGSAALIDFLGHTRNDLEPAACKVQPAIRDVLDEIAAQKGCGLSRMSGSGATCFGLFARDADAFAAAEALQQAHPDWWIRTGRLGDCSAMAQPRAAVPAQ
ncbi:4-diphosphocytidyl-2-C-methyl-D-erythritol kinase [Salipiger pallidus]|uniref:4-diphosphocytidyl-2-C-methyl-D-erythritol kinase n=1 Tax=Salipiger pallidus TaxID=1775170 RepID=A0A8J2ZJ55_9RHOB|nr:4-(cytidine 5'-diphospho)-2-C-methyl-D-erythritol kinase [Salipiger pallidus]GGG70699.1 4-diphosphocytidyl-2-C-methyl-D-erythritol kinase [Salipiger pallidus]